jgi:hypothetical protein
MGFRFRRRLQIIPGVSLNLGKTGASLSLGVKGAHVTLGRKGTRTTVGVPGTGMSWTSYQRHQGDQRQQPKAPITPELQKVGALIAGLVDTTMGLIKAQAQCLRNVAEGDELIACGNLLVQQAEKMNAITYDDAEKFIADTNDLFKICNRVRTLVDPNNDANLHQLELLDPPPKQEPEPAQSPPAWKFGLFLAVVFLLLALVGVFSTHPDAPTTGKATVKQEVQQAPPAQQVTAKAPKPHAAATPLCRGRMTGDGCQP